MKPILRFLIFVLLSAACIFGTVMLCKAQSTSAPTLPENVPLDGKVIIPVAYRGIGYKITADRIGGGAFIDSSSLFVGQLSEARLKAGKYKSVITTDYGTGNWYLDSTDNSTPDNTGTVFVTTTGKRYKRFYDEQVLCTWFGTKGDSTTNDTEAMKKFFIHCFKSGNKGFIPTGKYIITEGQLAFDNNHRDSSLIEINTSGYNEVFFIAAGLANAPLLSFTNGTTGSFVGKFWRGGYLGGITFVDVIRAADATNVHGLELRGIWGAKFGYIRGESLNGSTIYIPEKLYTVTNPDPYGVFFCDFEGIEANRCQGWALENRNYLGFNANNVNVLRVTNGNSGGWYGFGTMNTINLVSMGTVKGWAFHDGTEFNATGGAPLRFTVNHAEIDDVQNFCYLNRSRYVHFFNTRINHRSNYSPINPGQGYWPRVCVSLSGGASANTSDVFMELSHRIEAGGTKPQMGVFVNGNNSPNIDNVVIDNRIIDNAGLGFADGDLITNAHPNSTFTVKRSGKKIFDSYKKIAALATATTAQTVSNAGFGTATAKVSFPTERYDRADNYDPVASEYTIPYTALYRVNATINLTLPIDSRIRMAVMRDRAGVLTMVGINIEYTATLSSQVYTIDRMIDFVAGDKVYIIADQNTGAPVNLTATFSTAGENQFSIQTVNQ